MEQDDSLANSGRRSLIAALMMAMAARGARAEHAPESIPLWPDGAPDRPGPAVSETAGPNGSVTGVTRPRLNVYRPNPDRANGTALVVMPGGGYARLGVGAESTPTCRWLQSSGITAFELIYRLPHDGWPPRAPFQDGQRAVRLVRARAAAYGLKADRIGVLGFSAGGLLAGMTAVRPAAVNYTPVDAMDQMSARPDFAALLYAVLTMMPPFDQTRSRREILGPHPSDAERIAFSVDRQVDGRTPPAFLAQAADDPIAPIDNSLLMFNALRAAAVPAELHVFQAGGHGWGLGREGTEVHAWPDLFMAWMARNGMLAPTGPRE